MATQLDLQEQEQLDALKSFWKQYGNLLTWVVTAALAAFAGWNGWQWYQRDQATKAGALFDEVEKAVQQRDIDKAGRLLADLKERYPGTVVAPQAALAVAKLQLDQSKTDEAKATLNWVTQNAKEEEYRSAAQIRLAGVLLDAKQFDEALKALDNAKAPSFAALVADRRGDVLQLQGKKAEAVAAYQAAWKGLPDTVEYKRLVEAKLTVLAAPPQPASGVQP
jgi:predicted negative regulator of RcsB-dependent stress response